MKTNLTNLSLHQQVLAVMGVLDQRYKGGAKETYPSDLLRYFKHHGFRTQTQRLAHFTNLLTVAGKAITGQPVEKLMKDLERATVIFEVGDEAIWEGERVRIVDLIEDGHVANIRRAHGSVRTVSLAELTAPPASLPELPTANAT